MCKYLISIPHSFLYMCLHSNEIIVIYVTGHSESLGEESEEDSLQGPSYHQENPQSSTINCHQAPQGSSCAFTQECHILRGQERLPIGHSCEEDGKKMF